MTTPLCSAENRKSDVIAASRQALQFLFSKNHIEERPNNNDRLNPNKKKHSERGSEDLS
jgi:hypothetical protein